MWQIWYDDQCEICQAGLAWLRRLGSEGRVEAIPLSAVSARDSLPAPEEDLLRNLHARAPDGTVRVGAAAVAALARLFPLTSWIGSLAELPLLRGGAAAAYGWLARNRYSLSRCRGGACRTARIDAVRRAAPGSAFQICRVVGWLVIAPMALLVYGRRLLRQASTWRTTRGRRAALLEGRLSIHFLGGGISSMVAILFGELFTTLRYRSLVVDPGGTRMWRSLERELRAAAAAHPITHIAPTHVHEEHSGNLDLAVAITGATLVAHPRAIPLLRAPAAIPRMRHLVIGQPRPVRASIEPLVGALMLGPARLDRIEVIETPGHCDEHVSFYAAEDRLLLVGDGFMGTHFSSPNDDVDQGAWMASLDRMLGLEVDVMVEAHGHVHTLREDVIADLERQGLRCIVSRRAPRLLLEEKRDFLRWLGEQLELGRREGLAGGAICATMFPWTQRWSYESALQDRMAAVLSGGGFGRHKVIRSFRTSAPAAELPTLYELRWRE